MLLSVLITSHNQGEMLRRCVNSVLEQKIPFEYEIVISDDDSADDTWRIAEELVSQHKEIKAIRFNTDNCAPLNRCQRCAFNQGNAYNNSTGKYFTHIDADDFLCEGTRVLEKQVLLLEQYPECSCCMANNYVLNENEELSQKILFGKGEIETGQIVTADEYNANYWRVDHAFVYRRNKTENPTALFGGYYDDTIITYYHILWGDIVCLNEAGYVYVQYKTSIWNEIKVSQENYLMCSVLMVPALISVWRKKILSCRKKTIELLSAIQFMLSGGKLHEDNLAYIRNLPKQSRLVGLINKELTVLDKAYLMMMVLLLKIKKRTSFVPLNGVLNLLLYK